MSRPAPTRTTSLTLIAALALSAGGALLFGCSGERKGPDEAARQQYRKALLEAEDRRVQREEKREQTRVQDAQGALIASEERVGGILLPRGLTLRLDMGREWSYVTKLPADAVRAYFAPRLDTRVVVPGADDTVTYQNALPRDTPDAERVSVRIGPVPKRHGLTEVYIRLAPITHPPASEAEARLRREERERFAQ